MTRTLPRTLLASLLALGFMLSGCASTSQLSSNDRAFLERDLEGRTLYLRGSLNVMPFFSDASRVLASQFPEDSIELLLTPDGEPISPGRTSKRLDLGTRVRIEKIEQPTSVAVTRRPLYTPRTLPWIYFAVVGEPYVKPYVIVLRPGIKTREEFMRAFDTLFSADDPNYALERYTPEVRTAIREKKLAVGMDPFAVELAWGAPERIRMSQDAGIPTSVWTWPLGKRSASFREDRLVFAHPAIE